MEFTEIAPLFWAGLLIGLITLLFKGGAWYGAVNTDRNNFKEFMSEIKAKLDKIFDRLPVPTADSKSPVRLNDLGNKVSKAIDAKEMAKGLVSDVLASLGGNKSPYDVQVSSFRFVDNCILSDTQQEAVKQCAFDNGIDELAVRRVIAIELRDMLLAQPSLELK